MPYLKSAARKCLGLAAEPFSVHVVFCESEKSKWEKN